MTPLNFHYRTGGDDWVRYRDELNSKLIKEMQSGGGWPDPQVGPVYVTSLSCIMLQLDKGFWPRSINADSMSLVLRFIDPDRDCTLTVIAVWMRRQHGLRP